MDPGTVAGRPASWVGGQGSGTITSVEGSSFCISPLESVGDGYVAELRLRRWRRTQHGFRH